MSNKASLPPDPINISLVTSPDSKSLEKWLKAEIELLKPAILYADHVTIYSLTASFLAEYGRIALLERSQRLSFLLAHFPHMAPDAHTAYLRSQNLAHQLEKKKVGRTKRDQQFLDDFQKSREEFLLEIDNMWENEVIPNVVQILESSGASDILKLAQCGLVTLDPLYTPGAYWNDDLLVKSFVESLGKVLDTKGAFPLLDVSTGALVSSGIRDGLFTTSDLTNSRGKQATAASMLINKLPTFSGASLDEVLDIRDELQVPILRFRTAISALEHRILSNAYEEGFEDWVDELYRTEIQPAISEIDELIQENSLLRQLLDQVTSDGKYIVTGAITLQVTSFSELNLTAAAIATGAYVTKALHEKWKGNQAIQRKDVYLLHQLETRLR